MPEFLEAIPKRSMVAIGTHGFCKKTREQCEWYCFLENIINELEPSTIVVYGTLNGKMFDDIKERTSFVFFDSWITQRYKEEKKNGN